MSSIVIHDEVRAALDSGAPVVALESTIIAHGMPFPQNLATAEALERAVRAHDAVPATIAVLHGRPHVGLTPRELHVVATDASVRKLALRDLPLAYARQLHGATTVSATLYIAHRAGIFVFATGGIGGVHRGVAETWDISADVQALSRFPLLVVCAGAKAILDVHKTLEALETASVPVLVLAADVFPAFYTRDSGAPSPSRVDSPSAAAEVFHAAVRAGMRTGALLAVPLPSRDEPDAANVQTAIEAGLRELRDRADVAPAQVTPFLLRRVADLTGGASLTANMRLAEHNAAIAAKVAVHLARLRRASPLLSPSAPDSAGQPGRNVHLLVVGAAVLDVLAAPTQPPFVIRSTNVGRVRFRPGGVAFNVARAAARLSPAHVRFLSAVADDPQGRALAALIAVAARDEPSTAIDAWVPIVRGRRGAVVSITHDDKGDMLTGVADTEALFGEESAALYQTWGEQLGKALLGVKMVVVDANLGVEDLRRVVRAARSAGIDVWLEPTSVAKCGRLVQADVLADARYVSPNTAEAMALASAISDADKRKVKPGIAPEKDIEVAAKTILTRRRVGTQTLLVTRGEEGVSRFTLTRNGSVARTDYEAVDVDPNHIVFTTGAGDCFAGRCAAGISLGEREEDAIRQGILAAGAACLFEECVPTLKMVEMMHGEGRARL